MRIFFPLFSNKNWKSDTIILNEDVKTVSDEKEFCRNFSTYFANIVSDRKIPNTNNDVPDVLSKHNPVLAAINTFQNHPSVVNIQEREFNTIFSFNNTNENP